MSDSAAPRLYTPRTSRRPSLRPDPEAVGKVTESIARFFGTGRYLLIQTMVVLVWIALNVGAIEWRWDPYPFILLNLAFSTQAAYAAPLILLAQNRQDDRDRANIERDREVAARTQADTEFLARELAAVRLALADVVTTQDLEDSLGRLTKLIADRRPGDAPDLRATPDGPPDGADPPGLRPAAVRGADRGRAGPVRHGARVSRVPGAPATLRSA